MEVQVSYKKKPAKTYNVNKTTTVRELIDMVRADNNISHNNIIAALNGFDLKPTDKLGQISFKEGNLIQMYVGAASSAQPIRRHICIPRRTDIEPEPIPDDELEAKIELLQSIFADSPEQAPDRESIIAALENSCYNVDRAIDYLLPPKEEAEYQFNDKQKKDIIELTKLGYTPGTAIQVYFACEEELEPAKKLIVSIEKEVFQ